jgi:beta-aspartyl-peptidase (threonine type)
MRLLIHAGAGTLPPEQATPAGAAAARQGLRNALAAGSAVLRAGGPAADAVVAAVQVLEDDPAFNAGRGACLTRAGTIEHDAAWMDGASGRCGAVAGVTRLRSPVAAARLVAERSGHVLMAGPGAEAWCVEAGAATVDPAWFITPAAEAELARWRAEEAGRSGTVGAVALDAQGRLAAATSTGGLAGKRPGRIGDSPLIGCGTFADEHAAISATGTGEGFIAAVFAHTVAGAIARGLAPEQACTEGLALVTRRLARARGGAIVLATDGRWAIRWSSSDMARGHWSPEASGLALRGDEDYGG